MYYTPTILSLAGITNNRTALLVAMGPALVNAAGTVIGMIHIDRTGRRLGMYTHLIMSAKHNTGSCSTRGTQRIESEWCMPWPTT